MLERNSKITTTQPIDFTNVAIWRCANERFEIGIGKSIRFLILLRYLVINYIQYYRWVSKIFLQMT